MVDMWMWLSIEYDEDDTYERDPEWLQDLETAAAVAKLRDAVQLSTSYDDTGMSDRRQLIVNH